MASRKPHFIGNWKMNKLGAQAEQFASELLTAQLPSSAVIGLAPSFTAIAPLKESLLGTNIKIGAQNCHWETSGAHTGEISADMLKELGVGFVILGHSERRQFYGETSEDVSKRAKAVIDAGLKAIVCIGETKEEFEGGSTAEVVEAQLEESLSSMASTDNLLLAYEPVWAIGTGLAATPEIAQEVHALIRQKLARNFGDESVSKIPILYGGSTKPENIAQLMACPDIDGALVGGASLEASTFLALVQNGVLGIR